MYTVGKEIMRTGDFEIIHELISDTPCTKIGKA